MQHLLHSKDLSQDDLLRLLERAETFWPTVEQRTGLDLARGKVLATLFYEPSTRTRFSFETAMLRLGGGVISNAQMLLTSSSAKGETLFDTGRVVSQMADVIAMRHPKQRTVAELAEGSKVPVVNAGDGAGDHPTQGLLDLFTIQRELGRLDDFTIAMVGDLKNSRVVHAQCALLRHFKGIHFVLVAPHGLEMPSDIVKDLRGLGHELRETEDFTSAMAECDILSHTRIQKERFASEEEYMKYKGVYILTPQLMSQAKPDMIVLHPLPRVDEIDPLVDADPRAKYFKQVGYGVAMRMAVLSTLLRVS